MIFPPWHTTTKPIKISVISRLIWKKNDSFFLQFPGSVKCSAIWYRSKIELNEKILDDKIEIFFFLKTNHFYETDERFARVPGGLHRYYGLHRLPVYRGFHDRTSGCTADSVYWLSVLIWSWYQSCGVIVLVSLFMFWNGVWNKMTLIKMSYT